MNYDAYVAEIILRQFRGFESDISNLFSHRGNKWQDKCAYVQNYILRNKPFKLHAYYEICFAVFCCQNQGKTFFLNFISEHRFYADHKLNATPT
jgi:hypothetical protein